MPTTTSAQDSRAAAVAAAADLEDELARLADTSTSTSTTGDDAYSSTSDSATQSSEDEDDEEEEAGNAGAHAHCCGGGADDAHHPLSQPSRTPCTRNGSGGWCNVFERPGKYLRSEILVQRGILHSLDTEAQRLLPEASLGARNYLVTDSIVDPLYGDLVVDGLRRAGVRVQKLVVPSRAMDPASGGEPSTEPSKNARVFHSLVDQVLDSGISKHSCIISLGGAVVNNLCGVLAAMLYRGIKLVHIATTTMAALDGALDFKQAFNHRCGKNLLGAYYPADRIVIDPDALASLTPRHALNGIAEALKHGLTQSAELTSRIAEPLMEATARRGNNGGDNTGSTAADTAAEALRDPAYLEELCRATIEVKVPTLTHYHESDFNEMVPQYGHAPAHAIEHMSWHGGRAPLLHGEAVAIGMCVCAETARLLGLCSDEVVQQHYDVIGGCGLPTRVPCDGSYTVDAIIEAMRYDKHFVERPVMGLCAEIGRMARHPAADGGGFGFAVDLDVVREAFRRNMAAEDGAARPAAKAAAVRQQQQSSTARVAAGTAGRQTRRRGAAAAAPLA